MRPRLRRRRPRRRPWPHSTATRPRSTADDTAVLDLADTEGAPDAIGRGDDTWIRRDLLWSEQVGQAEWVSFGTDHYDILAMADRVRATGSEDIEGVPTTRYDLKVLVAEMYFGGESHG